MSKIDELIEQLCPDGVEFRTLRSVASYSRDRIDSSAITPGLYVGVNELLPDFQGCTLEVRAPSETRCIEFSRNDILLGNIRPYLKKMWLADRLGGTNGDVLVIRTKNQEVLSPKFLWQVLASNDFVKYNVQHSRGAKMPRGDKDAILNYRIPLPPMEIQEEIVRMLGFFSKLEEELERELEARREQYSYYLNLLLSQGTQTSFHRSAVHYEKLGSLFDFKNGLNKGKEHFGHGMPIVNYTDVYNHNSLHSADLNGKVDASDAERQRFDVKRGDVFFTRTSETREEIGVASVALEDIPDGVFSGFLLRGRPKTNKLLPEYCAYCFSNLDSRTQIIQHSTLTTRALTNGRSLSKIVIPVPPLEEQRRIVSILDKFDALVNDLSSGIPAEIEARRKQYEYYRDKLLTFKEKPSS